jgi:hypothetical protein
LTCWFSTGEDFLRAERQLGDSSNTQEKNLGIRKTFIVSDFLATLTYDSREAKLLHGKRTFEDKL